MTCYFALVERICVHRKGHINFRRNQHESIRNERPPEESLLQHQVRRLLAHRYRAAKAELADHDGLVATIYEMATTEIYQEGACCFNSAAASYLKDIRFCGKAWLMERVEARVRKEGY